MRTNLLPHSPFLCALHRRLSLKPIFAPYSTEVPKEASPETLFTRIDDGHLPPVGLLKEPRARPGEAPLIERLSDGSYFIIHERQAPQNATLPPILPRHAEFANTDASYHLNAADFAEMARLRESDPVTWTVSALARKFECSPLMVSKYAPCPAKQKQRIASQQQSRWDKSGAVWKAKIIRRQKIRQQEGW